MLKQAVYLVKLYKAAILPQSVALWRAVFAEFLAQILFVFLGVMSAMTVGLVNAGGDLSPGAMLVKVCGLLRLAI